jgi:hypothetical protein
MSRLLRLRLLALVVSLASIAFIGGLGAGTVNAAPPVNTKTFDVVGTDLATGQEVFNGTFTATSAKADKSAQTGISLVGDLTGQLTGQPGNAQGQGRGDTKDVKKQNLALPINGISSSAPAGGQGVAPQPACGILDLTLGPLDLDLLGLRVQLNQLHLQITAVPGPGNLLGNLLCQVAGLLDPIDVSQVVNLLNQILGLLGA